MQKSGPGAFGKAGGADAPPPQPQGSNSALSRDMERNAAQANALKTLDARRAANAPAANPAPPSQQPGPAPVYNQPGYAQPNLPPAQPIIVQQSNSGFMHGVIGFMLGRAMSQPQPVYYPQNNGGNGNNGGNSGSNDSWDSATLAGTTGATAPLMTAVPAATTAPSFGASVLRFFVWLALVSGMVWLVIYTVRKLRRLRSANAARYSFERN